MAITTTISDKVERSVTMTSKTRLLTVLGGKLTRLFIERFVSGNLYPEIFSTFRAGSWEKYESNPIIVKSSSGWDSYGLRDPRLLLDSSGLMVTESDNLIMYYSGYELAEPHYLRAIGRAVSSDGLSWTKYISNPVLDKGTEGEWDDFGVQTPSIIKRGTGDYLMYYSGVNAAWDAWGIGLATSSDGLSWTKHGSNPLITKTGFNIDGTIISFCHSIILSTGVYAIFFCGEGAAGKFNMFGATSADGISWTPLNSGNAILSIVAGTWESDAIEYPVIHEIDVNKYVMIYHGRSITNTRHQIALSYSTDLINWTRYSTNPIMSPSDSGWDSYRVESAFIPKEDLTGSGTLRMWYNGNSISNGENNSAIGYATCDQSGINYFSQWTVLGSPTYYRILDGDSYVLKILGDGSHLSSLISVTDNPFSDFIIKFDMKMQVDDNSECIPYINLRFTDFNNRYLIMFRGTGQDNIFLRRIQSGTNYISSSTSFDFTAEQWYSVEIRMVGATIQVWIDGVKFIDYTDTGTAIVSGAIGLYNYEDVEPAYFKNIVIYSV